MPDSLVTCKNKLNEICSELSDAIAEAKQGTQMRSHLNDEQKTAVARINITVTVNFELGF